MKSITKVAITALIVTAGIQATAHAYSNSVNRVINQLRAQGFRSVEVRRTLMGRLKIEANGNGGTREIVVDADTGHVFRDRFERERQRGTFFSSNANRDRDHGRNERNERNERNGRDHDRNDRDHDRNERDHDRNERDHDGHDDD